MNFRGGNSRNFLKPATFVLSAPVGVQEDVDLSVEFVDGSEARLRFLVGCPVEGGHGEQHRDLRGAMEPERVAGAVDSDGLEALVRGEAFGRLEAGRGLVQEFLEAEQVVLSRPADEHDPAGLDDAAEVGGADRREVGEENVGCVRQHGHLECARHGVQPRWVAAGGYPDAVL